MNETPFYSEVPKEYFANLAYRKRMVEWGSESEDNARALWNMCRQDPLFYVNTFCFTYDPRLNPSAIPFITYKFQDDAILDILRAIRNHDLKIEKSRDMGASWICLTALEWEWHFHDLRSFLMLSRKEDLVDKSDDPDALFWKIDFILENQPGWLRPTVDRNKLMLKNCDNGSTIAGDSTTGDVARGGRRTAVLLDEFAAVPDGHDVLKSTADVTNCRIFNSTPKGTGNAFYALKELGIKTLRLHWTLHPVKSQGLYHEAETGKPRSPWYDKECRRRHPMDIAQELDIDYLGSDYVWFDTGALDRIDREFVRRPYVRGDIEYDQDTIVVRRFCERSDGPLLLWLYPDGKGNPPEDRDFVLGVDTAAGTGASNSVISGLDRKTGEKILEYANPKIAPEVLAKYAVALARWLKGSRNGALLIWEANGPGRIFGNKVIELGYRRLFYRQKDNLVGKKISDTPGWYSTRETKLELLGNYREALKSGEYINRSRDAINECRSYVYMSNGIVAHSASANTVDPSGANDNHGDRVIADALTWRGFREVTVKKAEEFGPPVGSFAWRRKIADESRLKAKDW